jgi:hypothetical protein
LLRIAVLATLLLLLLRLGFSFLALLLLLLSLLAVGLVFALALALWLRCGVLGRRWRCDVINVLFSLAALALCDQLVQNRARLVLLALLLLLLSVFLARALARGRIALDIFFVLLCALSLLISLAKCFYTHSKRTVLRGVVSSAKGCFLFFDFFAGCRW